MSEPQPEKTLNERLKDWRQGDVILAPAIPFIHLANLLTPLTPQSSEIAGLEYAGGDPMASIASEVPGVVILSQTCDLIKPPDVNPFFELAALRKINPDAMAMVRKGRMPRYAFLPPLADRSLVADLDCVMTAEKGILALVQTADRIVGCTTEQETRIFSEALARKRDRFAFPDDFVRAVSKIQNRIIDKHGKDTKDKTGKLSTPEGEVYEQLDDIRIIASPSWQSPNAELTFLFLFKSQMGIHPNATEVISALMKNFKNTGSFQNPDFAIGSYETVSAARLLESVPLSLDHLSIQGNNL